MKGSKFLKITGILMIIAGALAIVLGIIAIIGLNSAVATITITGGVVPEGLLLFACILTIIAAAVELFAGIIGVKYCNMPEKAKTCIIWGFIVLAICVISAIINLLGQSFNLMSIITSVLVPVLYLIGAFKNKKLQG